MDTPMLMQGAIEVAKAAALSIPFAKIAGQMLGPAADEYAEHLRQRVRIYRLPNELKAWQKATKAISEAGFKPNPVPPKHLFPLLEGASVEENEDLHAMWAALLANASNPDTPNLVHPSFAGVLKQISPEDSVLLMVLFQAAEKSRTASSTTQKTLDLLDVSAALPLSLFISVWQSHFKQAGSAVAAYTDTTLVFLFNNLQSLFLVERRHDVYRNGANGNDAVFYSLTQRGYEFVRACQPPIKEGG